jgi:hypothetical protein
MKATALILFGIGLFVLICAPARAQQITGTPGSPSATTSITGEQLPPPDPKSSVAWSNSVAWSKMTLCHRNRGGHRAWCRPRGHPMCC